MSIVNTYEDDGAGRREASPCLLLFSPPPLSLRETSEGDDVPPGLSPLSDADSSQPGPDLPSGQKQTVWFSLQSYLGLHVPPDGNQNSTLGCH